MPPTLPSTPAPIPAAGPSTGPPPLPNPPPLPPVEPPRVEKPAQAPVAAATPLARVRAALRCRWPSWIVGLIVLLTVLPSPSIPEHPAPPMPADVPPHNCWQAISELPIQHEGRVEPFGRFARDVLKAITRTTPEDPPEATQQVMELIAQGGQGLGHRAGLRRVRARLLKRLQDQDLHLVPPPASSTQWRSIVQPDGYGWEQQIALKRVWSSFLEALRAGDRSRADRAGQRLVGLLQNLQVARLSGPTPGLP